MDAQSDLLDLIRRSSSTLLGPLPLEHSQELAEGLPPIRRHVGPRAWYQALEGPPPPDSQAHKHRS
jgi:hypothetical protein